MCLSLLQFETCHWGLHLPYVNIQSRILYEPMSSRTVRNSVRDDRHDLEA